MMPSLARIFVIVGIAFLVLGGLFYIGSRINIPLGKLPGDIVIQGKNITCFIPLATSIILSILFTIILTLITRFSGRR